MASSSAVHCGILRTTVSSMTSNRWCWSGMSSLSSTVQESLGEGTPSILQTMDTSSPSSIVIFSGKLRMLGGTKKSFIKIIRSFLLLHFSLFKIKLIFEKITLFFYIRYKIHRSFLVQKTSHTFYALSLNSIFPIIVIPVFVYQIYHTPKNENKIFAENIRIIHAHKS